MKEKFIEIYRKNIQRQGSEDLLKWLEATDFFDAPASTRYHLNRPGGLVEHSINVYKRLRRLHSIEKYGDLSDMTVFPEAETIAIVGLLHDVCKVDVYRREPKNQKTYDLEKVAAAQDWQVKHDAGGDFIWETVMGYRADDQLPYGHGEKSVYIISGFMRLTREEAFAIRYHMGPWQKGEEQNAGKAFERFPMALLTHLADMQATYIDEAESEQSGAGILQESAKPHRV